MSGLSFRLYGLFLCFESAEGIAAPQASSFEALYFFFVKNIHVCQSPRP